MMAFGFGIIIVVNLSLAYNAVASFPGLEVKNSYVASQNFDANRKAQLALGWEVDAWIEDDRLILSVTKDEEPVEPMIESAVFGRATSVADDQVPEFSHDGRAFTASVVAGSGNWNLRVRLRDENGALFQQRIVVGDAR